MIRLTIIPKQHPTHSYKVLRLKRYLLTLQGCVDQAAFLCNCPNELDIQKQIQTYFQPDKVQHCQNPEIASCVSLTSYACVFAVLHG